MDVNTASSMLTTMASMQEEHNIQVHPDWREKRYEYYRAIWVECAEMLDHFGWKWWKKQTEFNREEAREELADIWHFLIQASLELGLTPEDILKEYQRKNEINRQRQKDVY